LKIKLKRTSLQTTKNHEKGNKFQLLLGAAILIFSLLYIPKLSPLLSNYPRVIALSTILVIFGLRTISSKNNDIDITLADAGWLGLISLSFFSAYWSLNPYKAISGGFTTLLVYLSYKLFESIKWSTSSTYSLRGSFLICAISALSILVYSNLISKGGYGFTGSLAGTNDHHLSSLVFILLPFILIVKKKISHVLTVIFLLASISLIIYKVGSLQVFLCSSITGIFLIAILTRASIKKILLIFLSAGILALCSTAILLFNKTYFTENFTLLNEVDQQNNRFGIWKNSYMLFKTAPLVGIGKNNWKNEVTQFGLEDYTSGLNSETTPHIFNHAHNWFFQSISELGALGIICFLIIFISCCLSLKKGKELDNITYSALFSSLSFIWLGLMYGVVYNNFERFAGTTIALALSLAILNQHAEKKHFVSSRLAGFIILFCSVSCLAFFWVSNTEKKKFEQSRVLNWQGQYTKAKANLESISIWDPCQTYDQLAIAEKGLGNTKLADKYMLSALKYNPYEVTKIYNYALFLFEKGDYNSAYQYSSKAYVLCDKYLVNRILMIECLHKIGDNEKARKQATEMHNDLVKRFERYETVKKKRGAIPKPQKNKNAKESIKMRLEEILEAYH